MRLSELISRETGVGYDHIMFLRHSNENIRALQGRGGSVEEYTVVQPTDTRYDLLHPKKPPVHVLVVIVHDRVSQVYKIEGVDREGTTYTLVSGANRMFDIERKRREKPARRYLVSVLPSKATGRPISGWTSPRVAVARHGGRLFEQVTVEGLQ